MNQRHSLALSGQADQCGVKSVKPSTPTQQQQQQPRQHIAYSNTTQQQQPRQHIAYSNTRSMPLTSFIVMGHLSLRSTAPPTMARSSSSPGSSSAVAFRPAASSNSFTQGSASGRPLRQQVHELLEQHKQWYNRWQSGAKYVTVHAGANCLVTGGKCSTISEYHKNHLDT